GGNERMPNAPAPERRADGLDGEPLADCAEVEGHAGAIERRCSSGGVECQVSKPDERAGGGDLVIRWQPTLAPEKTPCTTEGRRGDIERSTRGGTEAVAARQKIEDLVGDFDNARSRGAVDLRDGARLAEDRQQFLEPVRFLQRVACRGDVGGMLAGQRDLEPAGHRTAMDTDVMRGRGILVGAPGNGEQRATRETAGWSWRGIEGARGHGHAPGDNCSNRTANANRPSRRRGDFNRK